LGRNAVRIVGEPAPASVLDLARCALSDAAANDLAREFSAIAAFAPPAGLTSTDRSFHRIDRKEGLDGRPTVGQQLAAMTRKLAYRVRARWMGSAA
jgi:hypothetical protein